MDCLKTHRQEGRVHKDFVAPVLPLLPIYHIFSFPPASFKRTLFTSSLAIPIGSKRNGFKRLLPTLLGKKGSQDDSHFYSSLLVNRTETLGGNILLKGNLNFQIIWALAQSTAHSRLGLLVSYCPHLENG